MADRRPREDTTGEVEVDGRTAEVTDVSAESFEEQEGGTPFQRVQKAAHKQKTPPSPQEMVEAKNLSFEQKQTITSDRSEDDLISPDSTKPDFATLDLPYKDLSSDADVTHIPTIDVPDNTVDFDIQKAIRDPGFLNNLDLRRATSQDLDRIDPSKSFVNPAMSVKTKEEATEFVTNLLIDGVKEKEAELESQANAPWYQQLTRIGTILEGAKGAPRESIEPIAQLMGAGLYGDSGLFDLVGAGGDISRDKAQRQISNILDNMFGKRLEDVEPPSPEKTKEEMMNVLEEHSDNFDQQTVENKKRVIDRIFERIKPLQDQVHQQNISLGWWSRTAAEAALIFGLEYSLFSATGKILPTATRWYSKAGRAALQEVVSGTAGGIAVSKSDDAEDIVWDGLVGAGLNLGMSGAIIGSAVAGKKLINGVSKFDEIFSNTMTKQYRGKVARKAQELLEAQGKASEARIKETARELRDLLLDPKFAKSSQMRSKLRRTFGETLDIPLGEIDDHLTDVLKYRYNKSSMDEMTPEQMMDMDGWLFNLKQNADEAEEISMLVKKVKQGKEIPTGQKLNELQKSSDWLNEQVITSDNLEEKAPIVKRLIDNVDGTPDDMISEQMRKAAYRTFGQKAKVELLDKQIGPSRVLAEKTAESSGVPMDMAYHDIQRSLRKTHVEYLNDAAEIDAAFRKANLANGRNPEEMEELFQFLKKNEFEVDSLTKKDLKRAGFSKNKAELGVFIRKKLKELGEKFGVDEDSLIKGYIPQRWQLQDKSEAMGRILRGEEPAVPFFKKRRELRNLSANEIKELERQGVEMRKDLHDLMKEYVYAGHWHTKAAPALESGQQMVDRLRGMNHPDAEHWQNWLDYMKGTTKRGRQPVTDMFRAISKQMEEWDFPGAKKLQNFFARTRPGDMLMGATYGNYLFAKQSFRLKNASQSMHTIAVLGERPFNQATKKLIGSGDEINELIRKAGIRGTSDQFVDTLEKTHNPEVSGNFSVTGMAKRIKDELFSFRNISASDRFNINRAFIGSAYAMDNHIDKLKRGKMTFSEFASATGLDFARPVPRQRIKNAIEENRIGMILTEEGERIRLREALDRGLENFGDFQVDMNSAEGQFARWTSFNTQWEYGKGAYGTLFWRNKGDAGNLVQGLALPFTTWQINYMYALGQLAKKPKKNADKIIRYMALGKAYSDAVGNVLEGSQEAWIPASPFPNMIDRPGVNAARHFMVLLNSGAIKGFEELRGRESPKWVDFNLRQSRRDLANIMGGSGTATGRAVKTFEAAMRLYGNGMDIDEARRIFENTIGIELKAATQEELVERTNKLDDSIRRGRRGQTQGQFQGGQQQGQQ